MAALIIVLTLTGVGAAMWHMGQSVALVLVFSIVLSGTLVMIEFAHALPPESAAEKRLTQRDRGRHIIGPSGLAAWNARTRRRIEELLREGTERGRVQRWIDTR